MQSEVASEGIVSNLICGEQLFAELAAIFMLMMTTTPATIITNEAYYDERDTTAHYDHYDIWDRQC